jgi:hypothetical protein
MRGKVSNVKMYLKETGGRVWTEIIWLRIGTGDGLF